VLGDGGGGGGGDGGDGGGGGGADGGGAAAAVADAPSGAPAGLGTILVVHGWVPRGWRGAPAGADGAPFGVSGVTRGGESPGRFTPANAPDGGAWFYLDPPAVLRALAGGGGGDGGGGGSGGGGGRDGGSDGGGDGGDSGGDSGSAPPVWVVEAVDASSGAAGAPPPSGYPRPRGLADLAAFPTTVETHAIYAVTWGGLAATLGVLTRGRFRGRAWAPRA